MDKFEKKILDNLKKWNQGKKIPPCLVTFRITNACDLKCLFCLSWKDDAGIKELEIPDYRKVLKQLNQLGVKLCAIIGGGEALVRKEIMFEIIKLAKQYNMKCWLVTNLMNLQEKDMQQMINLNLDTILISIDSNNPSTHDFLRRKKGSFDTIIKNIHLFNHWKKKLNKKKPRLKIQMLITNQNYKDLEGMIKLSKQLKISKLIINYLVVRYKRFAWLELNRSQTEELKKDLLKFLKQDKNNQDYTNFEDYIKIIRILKDYKKRNKLTYAPKNQTIVGSYCFQPWLHLNISEGGFINYCPELNDRHKKENVRDKNVEDIWYGKEFTEFRKKILTGKIIDKCMKYCNLPVFIENLKIKSYLDKNDKQKNGC